MEHTVNATLVGLDPGIYYVRGYIDMNTNARETYGKERVRDSWESWGYVSPRDGYTADMFMPTAIVIDDTLGTGDLFDLYIEDVDTNGNCLPDAWEMVQNKGRLDNGTENVNDTLAAGIEINQRLTDNLQTLENGSPAVAGLAAYVFSVMGNSGIAALVLDADFDTHSSYSLAAAAAAGSITTVANASNVEVTAMDVADDDSLVELTVSGDASVTTQSTSGRTVSRAGARLYSSNGTTAGDVGHLEGVVEYTDTLTPVAWQDTGIRADITVENGKFTTKFAVPKTNATQRFYRVVIQN